VALAAGAVDDASPSVLFWTQRRYSGNPIITVASNPTEVALGSIEQYIPAPIQLTNGNVWVYVKGRESIYAWLSTDGGETFSLQNSNNPVLSHGPAGSWDDTSVTEPSATYDAANNLIHLYYMGVDSGGTNFGWGHATASDSDPTTFTKDVSNPILTGAALAAKFPSETNILQTAVGDVIKIDGTFYFYGHYQADSGFHLIYATGSTWTNPVVQNTIGISIPNVSEIERGYVKVPSVFRMSNGQLQMIVGETQGKTAFLEQWAGYLTVASSWDGITWNQDPSSRILLSPGVAAWENRRVYSAHVLKKSTGNFDEIEFATNGAARVYYSGANADGTENDNVGLLYLYPGIGHGPENPFTTSGADVSFSGNIKMTGAAATTDRLSKLDMSNTYLRVNIDGSRYPPIHLTDTRSGGSSWYIYNGDPTLGDLTFASAYQRMTLKGTGTVGVVMGAGLVRIGLTGSVGYASGNGALYVENLIEVDGDARLKDVYAGALACGPAAITQTTTNAVALTITTPETMLADQKTLRIMRGTTEIAYVDEDGDGWLKGNAAAAKFLVGSGWTEVDSLGLYLNSARHIRWMDTANLSHVSSNIVALGSGSIGSVAGQLRTGSVMLAPLSGTNMLAAVNGYAGIFAAQTAGSTNDVELWSIDDQGNVTLQTSHDGLTAVHRSHNRYTGKGRVMDLDAMGAAITALATAKDWKEAQAAIVAAGGTNIYQTYSVPAVDWDAEQAAKAAESQAAISAWMSDTNAPEVKSAKPKLETAKPKPTWLVDALKPGAGVDGKMK
jgi:hypothetical protein